MTAVPDTDTQAAGQPGTARPAPPLRSISVTVIAQDPTVTDPKTHQILTSQVTIPAERFEPGPRSHRFHVVDYDTSTQAVQPPVDLTDGSGGFVDCVTARGGAVSDDFLVTDPAFRAQNVYAIAARVLGIFERYLGRRLPWSFGSHQLFLVPCAMAEANAYYAEEDHAVLFGYTNRGSGDRVRSCLSHDIVAHEVTHAILDGLRPHYVEPGLPDQLAFHEGFADLVALLSVFGLPEVLERELGEPDATGAIPASGVAPKALRTSVFFAIAEQFGNVLGRGSALRRSVDLPVSAAWKDDPAYAEPHRRGEVLVAAVMLTLLTMWTNRLGPLVHNGKVDRDRVVEEGGKAAEHLLGMLIRAIDYTPPVEFEFGDYLEAILCADEVMAPDDEHHYRQSLRDSFEAFGITAPQRIIDYDALDTGWPDYRNVNFDCLRQDADEVYRFIWNNAETLEINTAFGLFVSRVRHATRTGPDGLVITEVVADYTQNVSTTAGRLHTLNIAIPDGLDPKTAVRLCGGGTLIFDQFGKLRFHAKKGLAWNDDDASRQQRRLAYLNDHAIRDSRKRLGFSDGTPRGQRFNLLHLSDADAVESW